HDNPDNAEKCRDVLKEILSYPAIKSAHTAYAVGHAHIDVGWLWQVRESIRKAARTFASQLRLMEEYPDYVFGASQAQLYSFVKEHYPELFEEIKKRVREGRWEIQGGMWVEADGNLISGESMVRQFLHGKNFFMDEFGFDVKNLWLPDVFGYSAAMPQIIKKSGCDYFLTQKLSWSQINTFPHNTFIWQGIDGSSVLTHFPPENNYASKLAPSLLMVAQSRFKENGFLDHFLSLFGVGDGGGGPSDEMLEMGNREKNWEFTPKVKFSRADHFFEKLSKDAGKLEKWTGELYLEYHRGTLTSQARTKRGNRKCEQMLAATEFILSHLPLTKYPLKELDQCWKTLLLNQFHDIIPGSSISEVYEQTEKDHAHILEKCRQLLTKNAKNLFKKDENALLLVNTLSSSYNNCIELPASWLDYCITDENGEKVMVQKEKDKLIASVNLPGNSFTTLYKGKKKKEKDCFISGEEEKRKNIHPVLENDLIRYEFTMDGELKSAFDKEEKRELLSAPGNILSLYHDRPNSYEAWDIDLYYPKELVDVLKADQVKKI
ncbi:MAG: alpha-mannosidase, partial [Lentisphaeria bacterium]|nr:alpha-mannosidase [Lentisphaeria bacterium]